MASCLRRGSKQGVLILCGLVSVWLVYAQLKASLQLSLLSDDVLNVPSLDVDRSNVKATIALQELGADIDNITAANNVTMGVLVPAVSTENSKSIFALKQQQLLASSWSRPSHIIEEPPHVLRTNASCRVLIVQKLVDYHYEVLESVAMRYPLPWHNLRHDCSNSGLTESDPIIIDFVLCFGWKMHVPGFNRLEGWGWKRYFERYLKGRIRKRVNADSRIIQFRSIQGVPPVPLSVIDWDGYAAQIETTCDTDPLFASAKLWMRQDKKAHFCVVHGEAPMHRSLRRRTCYLNPQFAPQCWFIPADYPSFPPPPPPSENGLRVCIPSFGRDHAPLVQALRELKPKNITVIVNGRTAKIPHEFAKNDLSHYVKTNRDAIDYWEFQRSMSQCHVMIPLVENRGITKRYFRGNESDNLGKLSSCIAQSIGNRIPTIMHTSVVKIYGMELTAPFYEYNTIEDGSSFTAAFRQMLELYHNH